MALWTNVDDATGKPKFANTSDVYGVDRTEAGLAGKGVSPGWVKRTVGVGALETLTYTAGGTGYSNTNLIRVVSAGVNAAATLSTNSTGGITTVTITSRGSGFVNASPTVAVTNATGGTTGIGTGATFSASAGGRAGRITNETLVYIKGLTGDASDDTQFPDA